MACAEEPALPEITDAERVYTGDPMDRKALMAHKKVRCFLLPAQMCHQARDL